MKMELESGNHLLKIPAGAVENIRKNYDLDKPDRLEDAINILVEWILKQNHIIKKDYNKMYLERTLILCKGSVEKAKKQIDRLCTMKTMIPKYFSKTNVKMELQHFPNTAWLAPLPTLTEDYYRILMIKIHNNNLTSEIFLEYFQYNIILCEYLKAHDYLNGFILIYDFRDLNLMDLITKMNTVELQQFTSIIINGYGARLKSIYLLTDSNAIELLIKILKQFTGEKIANRTYVKRTLEDLYKVVPKEILPVEYGGNERPIGELFEDWVEVLSSEKHVEYMKMMNNACSDETKRLEGTFNEEYMGMPGSFRCLSVD